jgi:hypothetical protein
MNYEQVLANQQWEVILTRAASFSGQKSGDEIQNAGGQK